MINGIDYASVDGNKPPTIEGSNVGFVYQRAAYTYKGQPIVDPHLSRDRDSWRQHNVPLGAYLILGYDPAGATPEDQVATFVKAYGDRREGELPVALDVETNSEDHSAATVEHRLEWVQRAYDLLVGHYSLVMTYTSCNQWTENFGGGISRVGDGPLWLKVPYAWKEHNPPHPESCPGTVTDLPAPWRPPGSPGAWIVQYQGDCKGAPGFSSTVDLNGWLPGPATPCLWVRKQLARQGYGDVRGFQKAAGLVVDGVIGPKTFAALTWFA